MNGTRVYSEADLKSIDGAYFYSDETKSWWCRTPNGYQGNLANHEVIEHEDGSITVTPSILVKTRINDVDQALYHGYLTNGEWTTA